MNIVQKVSRNHSLGIDAKPGMTVRVARGRVWLTRDGDAKDYVLGAGDSMTLEARGRVVVFGLAEALVQVDTPERAPGTWSGLIARLTWKGAPT